MSQPKMQSELRGRQPSVNTAEVEHPLELGKYQAISSLRDDQTASGLDEDEDEECG
jgi:hypothetical protein